VLSERGCLLHQPCYDDYVPAAQQPGGEESTLMLLDDSLFPVVNQLDNVPGFAPMKLSEFPDDFHLPGLTQCFS